VYKRQPPIGIATNGADTTDGYEFGAEFTPGIQFAQEVRAAMEHGSLKKVSVGFYPLESQRDGDTITRTKVKISEISVVPFPAYENAAISNVREEQLATETESTTETEIGDDKPMSETNTELDQRQLVEEVAELRREVATIAQPTIAAPAPFMSIRSQGEFAKRLIAGDETAVELYRTYAAATSADTYMAPGWVGFINNLIDLNRPAWNVWSRGVLPSDGLTVDYAKVTTNGAAVGKQDTENTAISQGKIVIDNVSAAVSTYAGQTVLSRQLVERSSVPYLDTAFQAMSIAYANATNAAVVSALGALDFTGKVMDADGGTAKSILEGILDGAKYIKVNSGLVPELILCDPVAYKYLVSVADNQGRPIVRVDGAMPNGESIGNAAIPMLTGSIFNLPIYVDTTLSSGVAYLANSNALRVYESAGAPVRLTDETSGTSQATLSNSYAVYGYAAITVPFEGAIVKLDVTA
jgi:HK97 family phage major capsid protein